MFWTILNWVWAFYITWVFLAYMFDPKAPLYGRYGPNSRAVNLSLLVTVILFVLVGVLYLLD